MISWFNCSYIFKNIIIVFTKLENEKKKNWDLIYHIILYFQFYRVSECDFFSKLWTTLHILIMEFVRIRSGGGWWWWLILLKLYGEGLQRVVVCENTYYKNWATRDMDITTLGIHLAILMKNARLESLNLILN